MVEREKEGRGQKKRIGGNRKRTGEEQKRIGVTAEEETEILRRM